jgi:hypothetical protein
MTKGAARRKHALRERPVARKKPSAKRKAVPKRKPVAKAKSVAKAKPVRTRSAALTAGRGTSDERAIALTPDWRPVLRAAVDAMGSDLAARLAAHDARGWEHADSHALEGLEHWGTELARQDLRAGIGALVRVAQHGLPIVLERGGIGLDGMGFRAGDPCGDGEPVEVQVARVAAWLDAPDESHRHAVVAAQDRSRDAFIWNDDLLPNDDRAHWWYVDVGQCCVYAVTRVGGIAEGRSYYQWPAETCVGRGLVLAVRGLRCRGAALADILRDVRAVLVA